MAKPSLPKNLSIDNLVFGVSAANNFRDRTGDVLGRLTVLGFKESFEKKSYWYCLCSCGAITVLSTSGLHKTQSCGCLARDVHAERCRTVLAKHHQSNSPAYYSWSSARSRCNNPKDKQYFRYGGRGITFCERWNDFANFLDDMGERPSGKFSLDRIDSNGNYEPNNCRWAVPIQQSSNRRRSVLITFEGKTTPLSVLCRRLGLNYQAMYRRIVTWKWDAHKAFTIPVRKLIEPTGERRGGGAVLRIKQI